MEFFKFILLGMLSFACAQTVQKQDCSTYNFDKIEANQILSDHEMYLYASTVPLFSCVTANITSDKANPSNPGTFYFNTKDMGTFGFDVQQIEPGYYRTRSRDLRLFTLDFKMYKYTMTGDRGVYCFYICSSSFPRPLSMFLPDKAPIFNCYAASKDDFPLAQSIVDNLEIKLALPLKRVYNC